MRCVGCEEICSGGGGGCGRVVKLMGPLMGRFPCQMLKLRMAVSPVTQFAMYDVRLM